MLIYLTGDFDEEVTAVPLCVFNLREQPEHWLVGVFNPESHQAESHRISFVASAHAHFGVFKPA